MTEHVFRATDSESAMDRAIRELGEDALILSVKRVGEMMEIRAIKESLVTVGARPDAAFARGTQVKPISLSDAMQAAETRRNKPQPEPETVLRGDSASIVDIFLDDTDLNSDSQTLFNPLSDPPSPEIDAAALEAMFRVPKTTIPAVMLHDTTASLSTGAVQAAQQSNHGATTSDLGHAAVPAAPLLAPYEPDLQTLVLPDPTVTPATRAPALPEWTDEVSIAGDGRTTLIQPSLQLGRYNEDASSAHPAPVLLPDTKNNTAPKTHILKVNGFAPDIVEASITLPDLATTEAQLEFACQMLAERLATPVDTPIPLDSDILFIFGPPGAGKTTTAARLAFERIQNTAKRPTFLSIGYDSFVKDGKLDRHAQLLNTTVTDSLPSPEEQGSAQLIVDCSMTDPEAIKDALESVRTSYPGVRVQPVLTLPGTWSILAIKQYLQELRGLAPATIVTQMQIGGIGIAGLTALAAQGGTLLAATDSDRISDGLTPLDSATIANFLRDTFSYSDLHGDLGH